MNLTNINLFEATKTMNNPTISIYEIRQTGVAIGKTASCRGTTASSLSDPQFVAEIDRLRATSDGLNLHWAALLAGWQQGYVQQMATVS